MKDLFGQVQAFPEDTPKKKRDRIAIHQYRQLISIYGKNPEKNCKQCKFCEQQQAGSKRFYKCAKAKQSRSQATDWNSRWIACGLFQALYR